MQYYSKKVNKPPCRVENTLLDIPTAVIPLVDYYKRTPSEVLDMPALDVIRSLDIIYSRIINEQTYNAYLEKRIKKGGGK